MPGGAGFSLPTPATVALRRAKSQPSFPERRHESSRILRRHAGSERSAQALWRPGRRRGGFLRGEARGNGGTAGAERRRKNHYGLHDRRVAGAGPGRGAHRGRCGARRNRSSQTAHWDWYPRKWRCTTSSRRAKTWHCSAPSTICAARNWRTLWMRRSSGGVSRPCQGSRRHVQRRYEAAAEPRRRAAPRTADSAAGRAHRGSGSAEPQPDLLQPGGAQARRGRPSSTPPTTWKRRSASATASSSSITAR